MKRILLSIFLLATGSLLLPAQTGNKAVYGELGGNGLLFSANYDMRFTNKENGLGFRAGVGLGASIGVTLVTFPLGLNYLVGEGPHHLELGMGATYVSATVDWFDSKETGGGFFYMPTVGYRYAQKKKGFVGRVYVGPVIIGGQTFFPWGGISAGIKF
jgi:hypothetical protein